jgi:ubiquitin-like modifier-activating enzyme ATG7
VEDHSLLGATPDQVRGFLSNFQSFPAITEPFEHCICCSEKILGEFEKNGFEFVKQIILDGAHLMSLSGLDAFNARTDLADVISFNDENDVL